MNLFTCMYTQTEVRPIYSNWECKEMGGSREHGRWRKPWGRRGALHHSAPAPLPLVTPGCKSESRRPFLTSSPCFFFLPFYFPYTVYVSDKEWLSVFNVDSLYPFGTFQSDVNLFDKRVQKVKSQGLVADVLDFFMESIILNRYGLADTTAHATSHFSVWTDKLN